MQKKLLLLGAVALVSIGVLLFFRFEPTPPVPDNTTAEFSTEELSDEEVIEEEQPNVPAASAPATPTAPMTEAEVNAALSVIADSFTDQYEETELDAAVDIQIDDVYDI